MTNIKRVVVLLIIALGGLSFGAFLGMTAPKDRGPKSMKPLKVNDLPELGLLIVDQSNPSFDSKLASLVKAPDASTDVLKRFSVFVVNNNDRAVAAIVVNWEFVQPDGRIISKSKAVRQSPLFSNDNSLYALATASGVIPQLQSRPALGPRSSHMFSLIEVNGVGGGTGGEVGQLDKDRTDIPEGMKQRVKEYTEWQINKLYETIDKSVSWSVSIDGVFFEDGTFAGPDKTGFFENVKAEQDAKLDLLHEIGNIVANRREQDKAFAKVVKHLESVAGSENPTLSGSNPNGFYGYRKAIFARQILAVRKNVGDQRIIDFVKEELNKPRIQLIKQKTEKGK